MKKILFLLLFVFSIDVVAQSTMTDAQIIEFIQKEQDAGSSQAQIVTKLMKKGVDVNRLREVRRKYEKMGGQSTNGAKNLSTSIDRSRVKLDGGSKKNEDKNPATSAYRKSKDEKWNNKLDERNEKWMDMRTELGEFMPDTAESFDVEMEKMFMEKNRRKIFGHDIFMNKNLSFEPSMNIATPANYLLGPGDQVFIDIYGASQVTHDLTVSPDGDVVIEGYGPVHIAGLTVNQANNRLRNTLGTRHQGSQIKLTVGETRSILVNVMGEVKVPGTYTLSGFATVFNALYNAGGPTDIGTLRQIKVYRKDRLITTVDVYDYILNGKLSGNIRLADNDIIVVTPYESIVNITGKVKRPMFYEMKQGESLTSLLKYAGGFTGDAYKNSVRVVRKSGAKYSVWNVQEFDMNMFALCDEDSVSVDSILPRYENTVELRGAAYRPGLYQLGGSVTTIRGLIQTADGVLPEAIPEHAILTRTREDRSLEAQSVDIRAIMAGEAADIALKEEDILFVPSKMKSIENKTVSIYGEVYYPGIYQYAEGLTAEDLILQAGGLTDAANNTHVSVSRRTKVGDTDNPNQRTQNFEVKIQKGFSLKTEGFKLGEFDEVYVGKAEGYEAQSIITLDGEVKYRGDYALPTKSARLSEVVAQAGGLSSNAYAKGARVYRKMDEAEKTRREAQLAELRIYHAEVTTAANSNMDHKHRDLVDSLLTTTYIDIEEYLVGIELDKALEKPGSKYDIVLRDGDRLVIPQYDNTVKITGAVNLPTSTTYQKGKGTRHYIHAAGGYSPAAWKGHAYVVRPNGIVTTLGYGAKVEPGSEVIVPVKPVKKDNSQLAQTLMSAGSTIATIGAVLVSALRK